VIVTKMHVVEGARKAMFPHSDRLPTTDQKFHHTVTCFSLLILFTAFGHKTSFL